MRVVHRKKKSIPLKCDSSKKRFDFTQLLFGSICVSHWKCHLTERLMDNKKARKDGENIGKSVKRERAGNLIQ